ncbi:MAG TPA: hypothetical protein VMM38_06575 [Aridibacter sp.]|nr:hypothetical protein [Aridibacter sp.]
MRAGFKFRTAFVALAALVFVSCGTGPTGLRSLAPVDTAVYLETPDLGALLGKLAGSPAIGSGERKFDASRLNGMEVAVAMTGFEASESAVTDSEAVLNFQPQFTLIAETHAWSWQMESLVTGILGEFVNSNYGAGTKFEKSEREGQQWYIWTAADGRKAFAAVAGSQVFFGNNEAGVESCLAVKAGKQQSLLDNDRLSRQYEAAAGKLAFGYVSEEGVGKLSEFAGISMAIERSEEAGERSVISSVFPQLIRNSVREIVWTARAESDGIEDVIDIRLDENVAEAFEASMRPAPTADAEMLKFVSPDAFSVTRYNLRNPRVAFRSLLLASATKVDTSATRFVPLLGASLLQPYGVADPEAFLSFVGSYIVTVQFDEENSRSAAIVRTDDFEELRKRLLEGFTRVEGVDLETYAEPESGLRAVRSGTYVVIGDEVSVAKCVRAANSRTDFGKEADITRSDYFAFALRPEHSAVTVSRDISSPSELAEVFITGRTAVRKETYELTFTDFERFGIRRTYRSAFGFPGLIVGQFADAR